MIHTITTVINIAITFISLCCISFALRNLRKQSRMTKLMEKKVFCSFVEIDDRNLLPSDIGKEVYYIPFEGCARDKWEKGVIRSYGWRECGPFLYVRFKGPDGELCDPNNLKWVEERKGENF